jgi:hypothetical protein
LFLAAYQFSAHDFVRKQWGYILAVATALLEKETLTGEEVKEICSLRTCAVNTCFVPTIEDSGKVSEAVEATA